MNKIYPFKFLDSYGKDDTGLFFGRDEEIDALYQMIFQSNILTVYGASGAGKTSLIQCGLASRFQPHDWLALYIRRGADLNDSFDRAIAQVGGVTGGNDLENVFKTIYRNSFRPVYLIFDQFEELFILGTKEEQAKFIQTVLVILNIEQPVKMIFSMREEYIGDLYDFEKAVPQIMRKKLRVEPMDLDKVRQVITGVTTFAGSNISLKPGEEQQIIQAIFDKIKGNDKTLTIQLPYLQVFLDKLYMDTTHDDTRQAEAVFSMDTINKMGDIGDILRDFLEDQVKAISQKLSADKAQVSADEIWKILSPFATLDGTKEPISMQVLLNRLPGTDPKLVMSAVQAFITSRILRHTEEGDIYELSHDSLAGEIADKRSDEEIALLEVKRLLKSYTDLNKQTKDVLSEKQLNFVLPFLDKLTLTPAENELIAESQQKLKEQKQKERRRFTQILTGMAIALAIMFGLSIWAVRKSDEAEKSEETAEQNRNTAQSLALSGQSFLSQYNDGDVTIGFRYAQYAFQKDNSNIDAQKGIFTALIPFQGQGQCLFYKFSVICPALIFTAFFSPDGSKVVTATYDGTSSIWDAATGKQLVVLTGHKKWVYSAVFSHDGSKVVTASADSTAKIWDAATGKVLFTLNGHKGYVRSAVFSRDGRKILTASDDHTAKIWDAATGKELVTLKGHNSIVNSASFSPDGNTALTRSGDTTARIWNVATGKELFQLKGHRGVIYSAVFSPDGKKVVTASGDYTAKIWDAVTGKEAATLKGHTYYVNRAAFSPDSKKVVTSSGDKTARIWDAATGDSLVTLTGHTSEVNNVVFSPDGTQVITASVDHSAIIWDAVSGSRISNLCGHTKTVFAAFFSPDGKNILTASNDGTEKIWGTGTGSELSMILGDTATHDFPFNRSVNFDVFSPDTKKVVTSNYDSTAEIWDVVTGKQTAILKGHNGIVYAAVFSPDGKKIVTASQDATAKIWDTTGKLLATLSGHRAKVYSAFFSPDSKTVLTRSADTTARIWDAASGKELAILSGHQGEVNSVAYSPDGKKVITASVDRTAIIWDAATGKALVTLSGHSGDVRSAVFSPDGKKVVTASEDMTAKVWDTTGKKLTTLSGHANGVYSAVFSPDSKKIVTASSDNTAKIWLADTSAELSELSGHTDVVHTAFFSPDGTKVLTASGDNTARLWDVATGKELAELPGNTGYVYAAFFSPDGKRVLLVFDDHTSKLWRISIPDIINDMDKQIEDLDPQEKVKYDIAVQAGAK